MLFKFTPILDLKFTFSSLHPINYLPSFAAYQAISYKAYSLQAALANTWVAFLSHTPTHTHTHKYTLTGILTQRCVNRFIVWCQRSHWRCCALLMLLPLLPLLLLLLLLPMLAVAAAAAADDDDDLVIFFIIITVFNQLLITTSCVFSLSISCPALAALERCWRLGGAR